MSVPLFVFLVCSCVFCFCNLFVTKGIKNVRPDLGARRDNGNPTSFAIKAGNKGNLWGKCFLAAAP